MFLHVSTLEIADSRASADRQEETLHGFKNLPSLKLLPDEAL
jgi:hypothetical protein